MFSDYRIQSNANNVINLEVSTEPLSQALRSASAAQDVVIKLAKKNDQPVFSFEAQTEVRLFTLKGIWREVLTTCWGINVE